MKTATLQGLMGRKLRTALTALSIVLGVAMVSGTFVLTDTMKKAFDDLFAGTYKDTGAVISGKEIVTGASKSTVPESLQAKVAPPIESTEPNLAMPETVIARSGPSPATPILSPSL